MTAAEWLACDWPFDLLRHLDCKIDDAEVLQFLGQSDPSLGEPLPHLYAVSCRWRPQDKRMLLQTWSHTLALGQPFPTLPL